MAAQGKVAIYKMGQDGAITFLEDQEVRTGIYPVTAIKPNGAGDSFMAGLMTATATGVWLGISPPVFLQDTTGAYLGIGDAASLIDGGAGFGFDLFEEAL